MQIHNMIADRRLFATSDAWERFDGCFDAPGKSADQIRDLMQRLYHLDPTAEVAADPRALEALIVEGHARARQDFPGLVPDDLIYLLCPMAKDHAFVREKMHGASGFAAPNAVLIYLNLGDLPGSDWAHWVYRIVLHETNHTVRYPFGHPYRSFRDWTVSEGYAEAYVAEVLPEAELSPWVKAASKADLARLKPTVESFWHGFEPPTGNARQWFFGAPELGVPPWFGYALGFDLVTTARAEAKSDSWASFIQRPTASFG